MYQTGHADFESILVLFDIQGRSTFIMSEVKNIVSPLKPIAVECLSTLRARWRRCRGRCARAVPTGSSRGSGRPIFCPT